MDHYEYAEHLAAFKRTLQAKGRADKTVSTYTGEARRFLRWLGRLFDKDHLPAPSADLTRQFLLSIADTRGRSAAQCNLSHWPEQIRRFSAAHFSPHRAKLF